MSSERTPIPGTPWVVPQCYHPMSPCPKDIGHEGPHGPRVDPVAEVVERIRERLHVMPPIDPYTPEWGREVDAILDEEAVR